ncbi:MAG: hypothetical protein LBS30_03675 [Planctomycetota bacterium]|nr:hypothetical protein [Planctomycetota bacterium]
MSALITNQYPGAVGRMFARQNVSSVYGAHKAAPDAETEETGGIQDNVSLSPFAPKPLTTGFLEQALSAGRALADGSGVSADTEGRLREDRVFAAVSALTLLGYSKSNPAAGWPGGIPAPSREELEAARRRVAQRPSDAGDAVNVPDIMNGRLDLLQRIGKSDFTGMAFAGAAEQ